MKPYSKAKSVKDLVETKLASLCEGETFFGIGRACVVKHESASHEWYDAWLNGKLVSNDLSREEAVEYLV